MNILSLVLCFTMAFAISLALTPAAKSIAYKIGAIDVPKDKRRVHKKPIPRLGGLAIYYGFLISVLFFSNMDKQLAGIIGGSLLIVGVGIIDDVMALKASIKFVIQILAAIIVALCDVRINAISMPEVIVPGGILSLGVMSFPVTVLWIVGVTNAVNLIDGLDGLAAGVSSIASLCLMVLCILTGSETAVMFTAALAGSCLGFLPRNFNPAEFFMGDTGATFLGYVLAVTSIMGVFKGYAILALIVCLLSLGLPIFDTVCAMLRRVITHKPIMQADRGHLHHKLIDKGYSQKEAVLILYGISAFLAVLAIFIPIKDSRALAVAVLMVILLS